MFAISMAFSIFDLTGPMETRPVASHLAIRLPLMVFWLWLHLLVEDISNQRLPGSVAEDVVNKSWRPLPSGRISMEEAQDLLMILVPLTVVTSMALRSFTPSVTFMMLVWLYNDLDGANRGPLQRNLLNTAGLACFGWGALTTLLHTRQNLECDTLIYLWIALTAAVVMTTIHAQDFPDMAGDAARGRRTLPLVYSEGWVRGSLAALVLLWSVVCLSFWSVKLPIVWLLTLSIGGMIGLKTTIHRDRASDEVVWKLWCVWMALIYVLPMFSSLA